MGLWMIKPLLLSLSLTIIFEEGFSLLYGIRNKRDLLLIGLVNVLTNPPVVFTYYLFTYCTKINPLGIVVILELLVVFVEAYYFKHYGKAIRRPVLMAILINLFSYGMGLIINMII